METFTTCETVQKWVVSDPSLLLIFGDDFFSPGKGDRNRAKSQASVSYRLQPR